mmetsp:Transcript_23008/g.71668  ORF Transcript_23008/g.71668 Transcript_23008/m.71668 type:complete len:201 (+) Transcript_23008:1140-1742(+)
MSPMWLFNVFVHLPVVRFHILMVLSSLPVYTRLLEMATQVTALLWPLRTLWTFREARSHTIAVSSSLADTSHLQSSVALRSLMRSECFLRVLEQAPVSSRHTLMLSLQHENKNWLSPVAASERTPVLWPSRMRREVTEPLEISHRRTLLSAPPEYRDSPSSEIAMALTVPVCPLSSFTTSKYSSSSPSSSSEDEDSPSTS